MTRTSNTISLALFALGLTACKDGGDGPLDDTSPAADGPMALVTTVAQDYATGSFGSVSLEDWTVNDSLFLTTGDAALSVDEGVIYQINRYGYDNVRRYTPGEWAAPVWERSTGDRTNPYDAVTCAGKLFVSLYNDDALAVLDPATGDLVSEVDLSGAVLQGGPEPEATEMIVRGDSLYVALNGLDQANDWASVGGAVVEVDCAAETVTGRWAVGGNTQLHAWDGAGLLISAEALDGAGAGVWSLDPDEDELTKLIDGDRLSGAISDVAASGTDALILAPSEDYSSYTMTCADLATGALTELASFSEYLPKAEANDRGEAWVIARWGWADPENDKPGIYVVDLAACALKNADAPITFELAPYDLDWL
ncbi:hypothetical protein L6R49_08300 [Myxococcota bacterium]|nr:hypothetical protein [Myxococcota bacterium]